jgi:hypothetical protein
MSEAAGMRVITPSIVARNSHTSPPSCRRAALQVAQGVRTEARTSAHARRLRRRSALPPRRCSPLTCSAPTAPLQPFDVQLRLRLACLTTAITLCLRCSQAFAAGILPLLKMARAKLDQHMQQQQQARASPAPVGSNASSAEEKGPLNNTSPVVPLIASQKPSGAAVVALSGSSKSHPFSPVACPCSGAASPLPSLPTPGTLVKNRAASASASSQPPPPTLPAATPAHTAPPKLLSFAAAGGKSALSAVSPRLLAPKSARCASGGGWSASAFASSRPRGLVLHEEPRQDNGVISALSAGSDDVGSIGACWCHASLSYVATVCN